MHWYQRSIEETMALLKTTPQGLGKGEARARLEQYGPNELIEKKGETPLMMFLDQFKDFMILVLLAAAVISGFIGELSDTIAIMVIVVLNAVVGFIQQYRAERAMAALKKMAAPFAVVLRNGTPETIPVAELVPGDIAVFEAGKIIPADMRMVEAVLLKVDEAALTGESVTVGKNTGELHDEHAALGDRKNMAYKGTLVTSGRGVGIVVATGMSTELGRIAAMLQEEDEVKTPLQKRLAAFGQKLAVAVLAICALVLVIGIMKGEPPLFMFLTAISLAVAAIPEALPAVITISLALGAKKLSTLHALIRKLPAVETLGSVTYICSDKTGTLTLNKMTVEEIYIDGAIVRNAAGDVQQAAVQTSHAPARYLFHALALSNDARIGGDDALIGDPTEVALWEAAKKQGFEKKELEKSFPRVAEIPFDSERKCMTTFHARPEGGIISFTKGAIDVLLNKAEHMLTSDGLRPVDREGLSRENERMAAAGLRVLCIAMRTWDALPDDMSAGNVETGLTVLGLTGMMDPPREEAGEAVALCKAAGIKAVMITGDHPATARTIAARLGILEGDANAIVTGRELEKLSPEEFAARVEHVSVYARVAPEQKLKIVKALQAKGQIVAMTGDGVNDAPALKRADIGVAMGITGTDVSKEAAAMILLDDNFATIVKAVREGRKIYDNIRKFVKYLLTTNSGEIWTLFLAPLAGLPVPLLPIHLLWINLVTDGLPALALSAEPAAGDVMQRPPRHPRESIFAHGLGFQALWVGLFMAGIVLFLQAWSLKTGHAHWQTMVFTALCLTQLWNVLAIRSEKESLFVIGICSNKYLLGAVVLTFILQMATVYAPLLNPIFKTEPLTFSELMVTLALSSVVFFAVEIEKLIKRRRMGKPAS